MDRKDGLNIQIERRLILESAAAIEIELKRQRDNVSHGILRFLRKLRCIMLSGRRLCEQNETREQQRSTNVSSHFDLRSFRPGMVGRHIPAESNAVPGHADL